MVQVLLVTFPFFALVLAGYVAARRRMLPLEAIPGLNTFVLFFATPCLLFRFGASTPLAQLLDPSLFLVYLACALLMVGFVVAISMNRRMGWNDAAFGALVATCPNTGFMGVPLLVAFLGAAAAGPTIVTIVVDIGITTSLCVGLSRLGGREEHGFSRAAANALRGMLGNPMPWAILLGVLASAVQLELPKPVGQTLKLLADAASPVALFTIGAVLARSQMLVADARPLSARDYLSVAAIKLLVHPLLVLLVGSAAIQLGLTATAGRWNGQLQQFEDRPDAKTRLEAAKLWLSYSEGMPVQRQLRLEAAFKDRHAEMLEVARTPSGRKLLLAMGAIDDDWLARAGLESQK